VSELLSLKHPTQAPLKELRIGDLAKATKKTARALRLYEEMGLLTPGERSAGGYRLYGAEAIERVNWIAKLQDLGLSLNDIQDAVKGTAASAVPRDAMAHVRRLFEERLLDLTSQVARLEDLKVELKDAIQYLDGCAPCEVSDAGASNCVGCEEHPAVAPSLVRGVAGAAAENAASGSKEKTS
jgi:DNA-binding transcriptional MerR regulator